MSTVLFDLYKNMKQSAGSSSFNKDFVLFQQAIEELPNNEKNVPIKAFLVELKQLANDTDLIYSISIERRTELFKIIQYLEKLVSEYTNTISPIVWLGSPGDWGAILEKLAMMGYIEYTKNGEEINFKKLARDLQPHFVFNNKTLEVSSLAEFLNPGRRSQRVSDKFSSSAFKLPTR